MIFESNNKDPLPSYDVAIIGSGPAGLSLALALTKKSNLKICLIESGGAEVAPETQNLNLGTYTNSSLKENIQESRVRAFGGTSAFWGGESSVIGEDDFYEKEWLPISGWPIKRSDLNPYYSLAAEFLGIADFRSSILDKSKLLKFDSNKIEQKLWKYSKPPRNLSEIFYEDIIKSKKIHLMIESTVVGIENIDKKISAALIRTKDVDKKITAKYFVVACGGIENPRALLNWKESNTSLPYSIKNIGRYFAVHPYFNFEQSLLLTGFNARSSNYLMNTATSNEKVHFSLSAEVRNENMWDNFTIIPWEPEKEIPNDNLSTELQSYFNSFEESRYFNQFNMMCDMRLDPRSQITLGQRKDRHGLKESVINLHINSDSILSWKNGLQYFIQTMGQNDSGRLSFPIKNISTDFIYKNGLWGAHHHMCATRMASNDKNGVVDENLRVFGTENLFIAGASTFGTATVVNPTLSVVALSYRLSAHLLDII